MKRQPPLPVARPPASPKPSTAPYPHRNLGPHLKPPKAGEYVTDHHRGAKK